MARKPDTNKNDPQEVADLRRRLEELEQTLSAIQNGEVDALLISGATGAQVYTLKSAEHPYRVMIEQMSEGALTLSSEGLILYCNASFARMVKAPVEEIVTLPLSSYLAPASRRHLQRLIYQEGRQEVSLLARDDTLVPAYMALSAIREDNIVNYSVVVTDLSEHIRAEQIMASEKFTRTLLAQAADAILVCDTGGTIIRASERAFDLLGEDLAGNSLDQVFSQIFLVANPGTSQHTGGSPVKFSAIRDAGFPSGSEVTYGADTKTKRNLILNFSRITEETAVLGYSISLLDITERKRIEESLQRYAVKLEAANEELESFSYSVSHDLRAPLRSLNGFSDAVIQEYGEKLDETGKDYLRRIKNASQTMSQLIDDLLKLSRIGRTEMQWESVDLSRIARSIALELSQSQPERKVDWQLTPGLMAWGDASLLTIALRNLLENAFKFTALNPEARVEVGVTEQNGEKVYFVKDNGAGFDMNYADKLFQPFQRLHTRKEFSGTGIGLAIVQRIVRRHGGYIKGEGETGKGAAFYFTLEKKP